MSDRNNDTAMVMRVVKAEWPVVVAAVLACLVVAGGWAFATKPGTVYVATASVRTASNPTSLVNAPTPDAIVDMTQEASVISSAALSVGMPASRLGAESGAAVDGKVRTLVRITVTDKDKALAGRAAIALANAARDQVMAPFEPVVLLNDRKAAAVDERLATLQTRIAELEKLSKSPGLSPESRASIDASIVNAENALYSQQDSGWLAQQQADVASFYVTVLSVPSISSRGSASYLINALVRGGFIGLLLGVVLALVRERMRRNRRDA